MKYREKPRPVDAYRIDTANPAEGIPGWALTEMRARVRMGYNKQFVWIVRVPEGHVMGMDDDTFNDLYEGVR